MHINITDQLISQFFSGAMVVLALIAMGAILLFILKGLKATFPFTRMGIALALAPLSLINFLNASESSFLYLYAMIAALLGIAIDGLNHLLTPKEPIQVEEQPARKAEQEESVVPGPGMIVWEKAE